MYFSNTAGVGEMFESLRWMYLIRSKPWLPCTYAYDMTYVPLPMIVDGELACSRPSSQLSFMATVNTIITINTTWSGGTLPPHDWWMMLISWTLQTNAQVSRIRSGLPVLVSSAAVRIRRVGEKGWGKRPGSKHRANETALLFILAHVRANFVPQTCCFI